MKNKMVSLAGVCLVSISILMAGISFSTMAQHQWLSSQNSLFDIESGGETMIQSDHEVVFEVIET